MSNAPYAYDAPRNTNNIGQNDNKSRDMQRATTQYNSAVNGDSNSGQELHPLVHRNHMTVGEKKRLQWAKEREEEKALSNRYNQQQGYQHASSLMSPFYTKSNQSANDDQNGQRRIPNEYQTRSAETVNSEQADTYDPWGKPGGGARLVRPALSENPEVEMKYDCLGRPMMENTTVQEMRDVRSKPPQTSDNSKRAWMEELKSQMEEKKQRQLEERETDKTFGDMSWLDRFTTDHKPAPLPDQLPEVKSRRSRPRS